MLTEVFGQAQKSLGAGKSKISAGSFNFCAHVISKKVGSPGGLLTAFWPPYNLYVKILKKAIPYLSDNKVVVGIPFILKEGLEMGG